MRYFRCLESYALFGYKNESIKYTNCSTSTHPAKKKILYAMHAYVLFD